MFPYCKLEVMGSEINKCPLLSENHNNHHPNPLMHHL